MMKNLLPSVDPIATYLEHRAVELDSAYEGITLSEVAAMHDITLTFTSLEPMRSKRIAYDDDSTAEIIIDSCLPQFQQRREFMLWLVTIELERQDNA